MQVDASGRISMPLVGTIDARGKTAGELAKAVEAALRGRYVRNPEVTVNIKSSVSQVVAIDGQVVEPGLYPYWINSLLLAVREYDEQADDALLARWRSAMQSVTTMFGARY